MKVVILITCIVCLMESLQAKPPVVEGDIVLDKKLLIIRNEKTESRNRRDATMKRLVHEHKWKKGFVPYVISTELGKVARRAIKKAMYEIERRTCIQFSPKKGQEDFIEFIKGDGCYSNIGRQKGRQQISIGIGCELKNTVIHEILHALGMYHEQTRMDRDLYVKVLWWNVQDGAERNFDTYHHGVIDSMSFPYDYQSATHYRNTDFTKNGGDTLQSLEKPNQRLGNMMGMSKIDIKKIYKYYKCYRSKKRPQKASCIDKMSWCPKYTRHCNTKWFAEDYCQKSCRTCFI